MKNKDQHILSDGERKALLDDKTHLANTLKETELYGKGSAAESIDKGKIKNEINQIDSIIARGAIPRTTAKTKDALAKKVDILEKQIKEGMPSYNEMNDLKKNPEAIRKHMNWEKTNSQKVHEWKRLNKILTNGDPGSSNVERLRRR